MNVIATGSEGDVYLLNGKKILKHRKKNNDTKEFYIQHILYQIIPKHIIRPLDQFKTMNGKPIFLMNYLEAKSLKEVLENDTSLYPNIMLELLCKCIQVLDKIHKVYPSFRHNDLHADNVLVTENRDVYIHDFGLSVINLPGANHLRVSENVGVVPHNDIRYDYHFLINNFHWLSKPNSKIRKIIEAVIPPEYLGFDTSELTKFRLRPNRPHTNLPSRSKLVKIFCLNNKNDKSK